MIRKVVPGAAALFMLAMFFSGCDSTDDGDGGGLPPVAVSVEPAFENLSFRRPVDFQVAPDNSDRIYVVEQDGQIVSFENRQDVDDLDVFLDLRRSVSRDNNEEGLLGLAFHPDFASNGRLYVYYSASNPRRSVVSRFRAANGSVDPATEEVLMEVRQPFGNHNAGQLQFGPDGYLYISLGDGGSGGDPHENGQDLTTLLGSLLRIDVDGTDGDLPYAIPADNPFAAEDDGARDEIYAYGLRNPWRFSFDRDTGWLWLADVGQERFEEINIVESGGNYGWDNVEASHCFEPDQDCEQEGTERPIFLYNHTEGASVTGGYVYRGTRIPDLVGRYIYGDYVSGRIWALHYDGATTDNQLLADTDIPIASFGIDSAGEVYVLSLAGDIFRLTAAN